MKIIMKLFEVFLIIFEGFLNLYQLSECGPYLNNNLIVSYMYGKLYKKTVTKILNIAIMFLLRLCYKNKSIIHQLVKTGF